MSTIILKMEDEDEGELSPDFHQDSEETMGASMVLKQWSDGALEELINAYEPHTCLWITTSEEYKDAERKEIAFQKVDQAMQKHHFSRLEYTKKWTILRGQFLREVRRERSSNHKTGWRWYPKLEFLKKDEILFDKRVKSKAETVNSYGLPKKRPLVEFVPSPLIVTPLPPPNKHPRKSHLDIAIPGPHQPPKIKHNQPPPKKIVHQNSHEDIIIEYVNPPFITAERKEESSSSSSNRRLKPNTEQLNNGTTPSSVIEDQESLFGKMVATTLRKFSPYQRVLARKQIQDLLFEIELQNAAANST